MKEYMVGLNFMEPIEADSEEQAKEFFSERYDIKEKYLFAYEIEETLE